MEQQVTPKIKILMLTHHCGVKQELAKSNILEWVRLGEKVMLIIKKNKWKEKVVKRKRLKYLSVT